MLRKLKRDRSFTGDLTQGFHESADSSHKAANGVDVSGLAGTSTREQLVASQSAAAIRDEQFLQLVAQADAARDVGNWNEGEFFYWRALELYPYHPGYRGQYAHMLKEQGKFVAAELHYRSALAVGAPAEDIRPHLAFVVERNGLRAESLPPADLAVPAMAAAPAIVDIECLAFVMFHDNPSMSVEQSLQLVRECKTNREVVLAMIRDDRFLRSNRAFLEMLRA